MKHFVAKISKKITTRRKESYFNRLNWNIFLNRLENVFNEFKKLDSTKNIGYFYYTPMHKFFEMTYLYMLVLIKHKYL